MGGNIQIKMIFIEPLMEDSTLDHTTGTKALKSVIMQSNKGQKSSYVHNWSLTLTEMEYCASVASMLAEEIWQIEEGFVDLPTNLQAQFKK